MTKGDAKKQALRWLDEATLNGQDASIELTADYTDKFDYFLWNAVTFISSVFKLPRIYIAEITADTDKKGRYYRFTLPEDYMELKSIAAYSETGYFDIQDYRRESNRVYLIPGEYFRNGLAVEFDYWGIPEKFDENAPDSTVLEVVPKAEQLVGLRLAIEATAGSDETNAISAYLENKYSNMVSNLITDENNYFSGTTTERVFAQ